MTKEQLITEVQNLNAIIATTNLDNCYEKVVSFFRITSKIQDHAKDLEALLPSIEGKKFYGWKSKQRKSSEKRRAEAEKLFESFRYELSKAGRNPYGYNRTETEKPVTKDKVFFGDIEGINTLSIEKLEKCPDDTYVQNHVRSQIVRFVKSYKNSFNTDWLK